MIKTGDVVLMPLDDVDRTKVDGGNLIGVVVSTDKLNSTCRVAAKQGLLHRAYVYHAVKAVAQTSNNIDFTRSAGCL
jgi:phosphopantothenate synthetase